MERVTKKTTRIDPRSTSIEEDRPGAKRFRFSAIPSGPNTSDRDRADFIRAELARVEYPCLSDCLANRDQHGTHVLEEIERQSIHGRYDPNSGLTVDQEAGRRWRIRLRHDKYGHPYQPGDQVEWVHDVVRWDTGVRGQGRKISNTELSAAVRRGEGSRYYQRRSATVDEHGCIEVGYKDAVTFLATNGIHFGTGIALCRSAEFSRRAHIVPEGHPLAGERRHVRRWLYEEAPPWRELEPAKSEPVASQDDPDDSQADKPKKRGPGRPKKEV